MNFISERGRIALLTAGLVLLIAHKAEAVTFNNPGTIPLNENDDSSMTLWSISATCYPSNDRWGLGGFAGTIGHTVDCQTCVLSSNPYPGLFFISGKTVSKSSCSDTSCGNCPSCSTCSTSNGCMSSGTYSIVVHCYTTSYDNDDSGTSTLTISVSQEATLTISLTDPLSADNSMAVGTVLAIAGKSSGQPIVEYTKPTAVANSYLLGTANMFELNTGNGQVYVRTNPAVEYDYDYTMRVCIHSRRRESCKTITINFDGCFQTPNCNDQSDTTSYDDTFPTGGTLFTMTSDAPSAHFSSISSNWQNLNFVIKNSTLAEASLDLTSGVLSTTGNITVWPDHPHSTHTIVVTVTNPGHSCQYSATCTISMQIKFKNWPIRITNLPVNEAHHEDDDARTKKITIITYDYNNPAHDNVTCEVVYNEEPTLLELKHDDLNFTSSSWSIYKKVCQVTGCGYIDANFLCTEKIGCLNYDIDNEYTMTVKCTDAYGEEDTETFTLSVTENQPPNFTNTPTTITVNTDNIAHLDNIFSIYYTDAEFEPLDYNYTISPTTPSLFAFDDRGNYNSNPANVTTTIFQWDLVNTSFSINFCGRERRNIVCSSFTIDIREYCGPTPACSSASTSKTDEEAVEGTEVFQIAVTTSGYTSLTYVITSEYPNLFSVHPSTGSVTLSTALEVSNPPNPSTYSIVANVYDTAACAVAACDLTLEVTFTNKDISITNMGSVSKDIHEDTTTSVTIVTIATSDNNTIDGVDCEVDEAASTPVNNTIFSAVETDTDSDVFQLVSKEGPGFDYDMADTYKIVVVCRDNYGSSDTATATVSILENQEPTIDNLNAGDILNVDPITIKSGTTIFTLQTSDDENDPLVYSCNVTDSFVPLQCLSDGVVSMKRDVRIPDEEGQMYPITLCIEENVHNHVLCETLTVNISSSKTNPELNNLPAAVSFAENSAVGTTLFTATIEDPDALDVHTFSMIVYPKTASSAFSLDANTGVLTLQGSLDYETLNHYEFLFSVRDVYLPGLAEKYLNLTVTDVNESPVLTLHQTTYETIEESTGYVVATLNYSCTDVDNGQTMTISLTSGTHISFFTLDPTTGIITYAQDWDFENVAVPQTTSLEITCSDGNGLSDTGNIVVNIALVNEFSPVLSTTSEDIIIYSNQTLIDPLFTITASDDDYGDDGVFVFSILGVGKGSKYFTISSTGSLFIKNYIDMRYNSTMEFTIRVSDGETNPNIAHVDVNVTYLSTYEIPIPTKESAKCILCTSIGRTVVAILCVECFLSFMLFVHIFCRMKAYQICQLHPKEKLTTVTDMRRAMQSRQELSTEPYRPESTTDALPKQAPPSPYMYHSPKVKVEPPPPAAQYRPPNHSVNQKQDSDPSERLQRKRRLISGHTAAAISEQKGNNIPSLFQSAAYAPTAMNQPWGNGASNIYAFTQRDMMLARPDVAADDEEIMMRPMFSSPDESALYSDNSRELQDIGPPADALDY